MKEPAWIGIDATIAIHDRQIAEHGGGRGLRDLSMLASAVQRPLNKYRYGEAALHALAAAYAYGIARNHPFVDGNKRTALVVSFTFLLLNGRRMTSSYEENVDCFIKLAAGSLTEEKLAQWFKRNAAPD